MIAHILTAAKARGLFEHVLVSTDDEEIAGVARQSGAEVPFKRRAECYLQSLQQLCCLAAEFRTSTRKKI